MEYAYSYLLYNWKKIDSSKAVTFDNIKAHRMFVGSEDENGFMMVHVAMDSYSNRLVDGTDKAIVAAKKKDRVAFNEAMEQVLNSMKVINSVFT